jgi:hypothetical protein
VVDPAADQVAKRVAAERVGAEQHDVEREDQSPHPESERLGPVVGSVNQSACHTSSARNAMTTSESRGSTGARSARSGGRSSRPILRTRLADRARGRIGGERLVVGAAIVIAGEPESAGIQRIRNAAEKGRIAGHQDGFGPKKLSGERRAPASRRAKGRSEPIVLALEGRPVA